MHLPWWFVAAAGTLTCNTAFAGTTTDFRFEDRARLQVDQRLAGRVYVSDMVASEVPVPLVVFLHGTNPEHRLHRWMRKGPFDLRVVVENLFERKRVIPLLLAAPSQTRNAEGGNTLWSEFDLDAFVSRTQDALGDRARIDDGRVVVVGHSGAGCNRSGGLLGVATRNTGITPAGIVAIDTCMNAEKGRLLAAVPASVVLGVYWQPFTWARDFDSFIDAISAQRVSPSFVLREFGDRSMLGPNPHYAIVRPAVVDTLERLFPFSQGSPETYLAT